MSTRYDREHAWESKRKGERKRIMVHVYTRGAVRVAWDDPSCDPPVARGYVVTTRDAMRGAIGNGPNDHNLYLTDRSGVWGTVQRWADGTLRHSRSGEIITFQETVKA